MKDDASSKKSPAPKPFKPPKIHVTFSGAIYIDPDEYLIPPVDDEETREKVRKLLKERPELAIK